MRRTLLICLVLAVYALHQDIWYWRATEPLLFGFLPPALFYHAGYSIMTALLMALLVRFAWPAHLEDEVRTDTEEPRR